MATFTGPNGPVEVSDRLAAVYEKTPGYARVEEPAEDKPRAADKKEAAK